MRRLSALSLLLLASACVAPRQPAPPPPPAPAPPPPPPPAPPAADWRDRPYTPGDWSYGRAGGVSEARYGAPGAAPLTLVCDPGASQVRLSWPGAPAGPVTIRTTYGDTVRQSQPSEDGAQIVFAARDPLLDQMAFSRGRFMLSAGAQALIAPAWPEISRVIEDCR